MQLDLFPLHTVLFPHMRLPLHVFEPRYRVMIRACIDEERPFGVALIRSGDEVGGPGGSSSRGDHRAHHAATRRCPTAA